MTPNLERGALKALCERLGRWELRLTFARLQINTVEGKEQRGMHLFKCGDAGAAKELSEKLLEFV